MDITMIVIGLIAIAAGLIGLVIPQVRMKLTTSQWQLLCNLAYTGVTAVQQIYKNQPNSEELQSKKFEEVKAWLESRNLKVNEEDIEKAIEAAVIRMKQELAQNQKQI